MNLSARVRKLEKANGVYDLVCLSISAETEQEYEAGFLDLILSERCIVGRRHVVSGIVAGVERTEDFVLSPHEAALEHLHQ